LATVGPPDNAAGRPVFGPAAGPRSAGGRLVPGSAAGWSRPGRQPVRPPGGTRCAAADPPACVCGRCGNAGISVGAAATMANGWPAGYSGR